MAEPVLVTLPIEVEVLPRSKMFLKQVNIDIGRERVGEEDTDAEVSGHLYHVYGGTVEVSLYRGDAKSDPIRVTIPVRSLLDTVLDHEEKLRLALAEATV